VLFSVRVTVSFEVWSFWRTCVSRMVRRHCTGLLTKAWCMSPKLSWIRRLTLKLPTRYYDSLLRWR